MSSADEARTELSPLLFMSLSLEPPRNLVGHLKNAFINYAPVQRMIKVRVTDPVTDEFETKVTGLGDYRTVLHNDAVSWMLLEWHCLISTHIYYMYPNTSVPLQYMSFCWRVFLEVW